MTSRCGRACQGGLYAHFSSKEAVFEALIARHLSPAPLDVEAVVDGASSTRDLAERIVDQLYVSLANPAMISAMRLLLAESARVPQLAARWRRETTDAQQACLARLLEQARARGLCAGGVAQEHPGCCCRPSCIPWWPASCSGPRSASTWLPAGAPMRR